LIVAAACLLTLAVGFSAPAAAYTMEITQFEICSSAVESAQISLEATLKPANEFSNAPAGAPATLSGRSDYPVTFAVASTQTALSHPDIESGLGFAELLSSGPPPEYTYTFTSTKAAAKPGTVYWDASFSTAAIPACAGLPPSTRATQPRTLNVSPPPPTEVAMAAPPITSVPAPAPTPAPLGISIVQSSRFSFAHPTFSYRIDCTASCVGDTYYQVLLLRPHRRARHVAELDLDPTPVTIPATSGGNQQFSRSYRGGTLRVLASDLRAGDVLELQINVKATGVTGIARAQSTARLRA